MDFLVIRISESANLTTQEFLDRLLDIFPGYKVELIEITSTKPVVEVGWWVGVITKIPLKVIRETTIWRDTEKKVRFATAFLTKEDLEYHAEIKDMGNYKMAKVYDKFPLWVDANDVRPK